MYDNYSITKLGGYWRVKEVDTNEVSVPYMSKEDAVRALASINLGVDYFEVDVTYSVDWDESANELMYDTNSF